MSKVVLFSTRHIHEENYLFGKNCQSLVSKDGKEFSPLVDYFRACDTKNELFGKYKDSNKRIRDFLAKNNKWDSEFEGKPMKDVIPKVLPKLNEEEKKELRILTKERNESTSKASQGFDYEKLWNDVLSNTDHLKGLDIDKNQATLKDRFSIYTLDDPKDALTKEYVFMAIWPLSRAQKFNNDGTNLWISTLVQQICKLVENCEEITLLLHDKDICESQPFKIIVPRDNYTFGSSQKGIILTVAIFQHTSGDLINDILNKPETNLSKLYTNVSAVLTNAVEMMKAGNAHTTRQVYEKQVETLDNKTQVE